MYHDLSEVASRDYGNNSTLDANYHHSFPVDYLVLTFICFRHRYLFDHILYYVHVGILRGCVWHKLNFSRHFQTQIYRLRHIAFPLAAQSLLGSRIEFAFLYGRHTLHEQSRFRRKEDAIWVYERWCRSRAVQGGTKCLLLVQTLPTEHENTNSWDKSILGRASNGAIALVRWLFETGGRNSMINAYFYSISRLSFDSHGLKGGTHCGAGGIVVHQNPR